MFRRRIPVFALSLGCAGVAGWSMARYGDAEAAAPQEIAPGDAPPPAAVAAPQLEPGPTEGDLLAQARASIREGEIDPELLAALGRSADPQHKHAHRLLVAQTPTVAHKSQAEPPKPTAQTSAVEVTAPAPAPQPSTPAQPHAEADQANPGTQAEAGAPTRADTPISVLTSMKLERIGSVVALTFHGSDTVDVGIVAQGDTDKKAAKNKPKTRRFVVEAAGAIPTFLQARPTLEGVAVKDVRRGDKTVQIEVQLDPGWKVSVRSKLDNGFRITFRKG